MNQKTRKTKRAMILLLSLAMILTSVFSMPLSYAADEKEDPLPDSMQVGVGGVVDEGADVEPIKNKISDETMYTPLYLLKHGNSEYVDTTKINLNALAQPVAIARGIATYNYGKQKEWKYTANSIASMYYEVPVYDLDKESDYYVAIPNVALNSKEIGTYDFVLGYNNDYGETINDYVYDDDIVYIKKDVLDHPKNEHALNSDDVVLAMQLNYYFKGEEDGEEDMFSKTIPVQILDVNDDVPEHKTVKVENIFADESVSFPIGNYSKDKLSVLLNGMVIPIDSGAYDISNGILTIYSSAAVIGSVNVVVEDDSFLEKITKNMVENAYAGARATPSEMAYYKTKKGKRIILAADVSDIFVGWRGHYQAPSGTSVQNCGTQIYDGGSISHFKSLPEWENSLQYMYGAYTTNTAASDPSAGYWALASYTKGQFIQNGHDISRNTEYTLYGSNSDTKKTMYRWLRHFTTENGDGKLERNNGSAENNNGKLSGNGIGGYNNFAIPFPGSKIYGDETNLVSLKENGDKYEGYGKEQKNIRFDMQTASGASVLDAGSYFGASCAHLNNSTADEGTYDGANKRTVYVSCLALDESPEDGAEPYIVLAFAIRGISAQEAMAIYKFQINADGYICFNKVQKKANSKDDVIAEDGAKFRVWNKDYSSYDAARAAGSQYAQTLTQDGNKPVISGELHNGKYRVEQVSAGKQKDVARLLSPFDMTVEAGEYAYFYRSSATGEIKFGSEDSESDVKAKLNDKKYCVNPPYKFDLKIRKLSEDYILGHFGIDTLKSMEVKFTLEAVDTDDTVATEPVEQNTDGEGVVTFEDIEAGTYKITETVTAPGFFNNPDTAEATIVIGVGGTIKKIEQIGHDSSAVIGIEPDTETSDDKVKLITWTKKDTPQNTTLDVYKNRSFKNEANETELQPQPNVEFNLYAQGDIVSYDGHEDHIYYHDGDLIQGIMIDEQTGARTYYVDGKEVASEDYRIITDSKGEWHSIDTSWKYYPLTNNDSEYVMQEMFTWEQGSHISFDEDEKSYLTDIWVNSLKKSATDPLKGVGEMTFEQVLNHGIDVTSKSIKNEDGNIDKKEQYSSNGHYIDDNVFDNFIRNRIAKFITNESVSIKNEQEISVGTIARNVMVISPSEAASPVNDIFQVLPFESDQLTTSHASHFTDDQVPVIETVAEVDGKEYIPKRGKVTVKDTIKYDNLTPGLTYTVVGNLYDKESGKLLENSDGEAISATAKLTPKRKSGSTEVSFKFDAELVKGALVAYEKLYLDGELVGSHEDPNDDDQTTNKEPDIGTYLTADGKKAVVRSEKTEFIDTIKYEGFIPGHTYVFEGTLMLKDTGDPLIENGEKVKAVSEEFVPPKAAGTAEVKFTVDTMNYYGREIVAFEVAYEVIGDKKIEFAKHEDINDPDQTVTIEKEPDKPEIGTYLTDKDGHKSMTASKKTVLIDRVKYKNLDTNKWYGIKGTLVFKSTGRPVTVRGKAIAAYSGRFNPKKPNGTKKIKFTLDTRKLAGKEIVAYETLYELTDDEEIKVAEHKDLNDQAQIVKINKPEEPEEPEEPNPPTKTRTPGPKTGDYNKIGLLIGLLLTSLAALICLIRKKMHKPIK